MIHNRLLPWGLVITALVAALAGPVASARRAAADARRELRHHAELARQVATLRAIPTAIDASQSDPDDRAALATLVSASLGQSGIPATALSSLSPESAATQRADRELALVTRRATLVLTPVTLPQLGRFVQAWREQSPSWTIGRVDVDPRPGDVKNISTTGGDMPLRVSLGLERTEVRELKDPGAR